MERRENSVVCVCACVRASPFAFAPTQQRYLEVKQSREKKKDRKLGGRRRGRNRGREGRMGASAGLRRLMAQDPVLSACFFLSAIGNYLTSPSFPSFMVSHPFLAPMYVDRQSRCRMTIHRRRKIALDCFRSSFACIRVWKSKATGVMCIVELERE